MDKWSDWLLEHYQNVCASSRYPVFGCFLHGSQNYQLDDESSDVDAKCFVITPKGRPYSDVKHPTIGGQTLISNIEAWLKKLSQGRLTFLDLEYIITDYFIVSPPFKDEFLQLRESFFEFCDSCGYRSFLQNSILKLYQSNCYVLQERERFCLSPLRSCKVASYICQEAKMLQGFQQQNNLIDIVRLNMLSKEERQKIIDIKRGKVSYNPQEWEQEFAFLLEEPFYLPPELEDKINNMRICIENKTKKEGG